MSMMMGIYSSRSPSPQLDDIPEKKEVIRLVREAIEKKKRATALREQDDE